MHSIIGGVCTPLVGILIGGIAARNRVARGARCGKAGALIAQTPSVQDEVYRRFCGNNRSVGVNLGMILLY